MIPAWCFAWERRSDHRFDIYNGGRPALLRGDGIELVGLLTRTHANSYNDLTKAGPVFFTRLKLRFCLSHKVFH
jgi:hypothetical protein